MLPKSKVKTLFFRTKHPSIGRHICLKNPACARESVDWLSKEWRKASINNRRRRMKLLKQAAVAAANRAKVGSANMRYSAKERKEFAIIHQLYFNWYRGKLLPKK